MRRVHTARGAALAALIAVAASAVAAIDADPADLALFRRILRESHAYDAKWLGSYSVRYSSRSILTHSASGESDVTAREGFVIVDGTRTSIEDERTESDDPGRAFRMDTVTDGRVEVVKITPVAPALRPLPAKVLIRPDDGKLGQDLATPLQWLSIERYWRANHSRMSLDSLLTGHPIAEASPLMGDTGQRESLTRRVILVLGHVSDWGSASRALSWRLAR